MTMRTRLLALFALLVITLGGGAGLFVARAQDGTETEQRSAFLRFVEDKISTPDRRIHIGSIDGALSSDVRISDITIADRTGVWLKLSGVHMVWSRLALLGGHLNIDLLEAQSIEMTRRPVADQGANPAASGPLQVPVLPVSVQITKLTVPRVSLPADLTGQPAVLAVDGAIKLDGGALDTKLTIDRTDGPAGRLAFAATYANDTKQLGLNLDFSEPKNGLLSNLLGIDGRPSLHFSIAGNGPLDRFAAQIALDADGQRLLSGDSTIASADNGLRFVTQLNGTLAPLLPKTYADFVSGQSTLSIDATRANDGTIRLDRADVKSGVLQVAITGALGADSFPTAIRATGKVGGDGQAAVQLPGSSGSKIGSADFDVSFGGGSPQWNAAFHVNGLQNATLAIARAAIEAKGEAQNLADAAKRSLTFTVGGRVEGLKSSDPGLSAALGPLFTLAMKGDWAAGGPVNFSEASVANANASAGFVGRYDQNGLDGAYAVKAGDIAPFSQLAGRPLKGSIDLKATGNYFPVGGTFSLRLDGKAGNLMLGQAVADPLLKGTTALSGILSRSEDGLHFTDLTLASPQFRTTLTGTYGRWQSDVSLAAHLNDLAAITDRASGAVDLAAHVAGPNETAVLTASLTAPRAVLQGKVLQDARLDLDGTLSGAGIDGKVKLAGRLGTLPVAASATLANNNGTRLVQDLVFTAASTRASGSLAIDPAGRASGNLAIASPDIAPVAPLFLAKASGAVDLKLALSAPNGRQDARITGNARNLRVETLSIGTADLDITAADLTGARALSGTIGATAISLPQLSIPKLSATAKPNGSRTDFQLDASLVHPGIAPLALAATGSIADQRVALDARLTGGGIALRANGAVPFSGSGLALAVTGTVPLALANPSLATRGARIDGNANIDAKVSGSFAAPAVAGTATVAGASLVDPTSGTRLSNIALSTRFTGTQAVIDRLSASVGGGSISASGSIGFAPGSNLPVNLQIALQNAKLSDGEIATATMSGNLKITGALLTGPSLTGQIRASRVEVTLPEKLSAQASLLDVKHRRPPPNLKRLLQRVEQASAPSGKASGGAGGMTIDITISAPSGVFVGGRGVDAELGGQLRLQGSLANIMPTGGFDLIRGRLDIIGQSVTLSRGRVTLVGDLNPFVEFTAESNSNSVTVDVTVTGRVSDLTIQLSSSPSLPQDEILSQFLFGKSVADLSPFQIARLAAAVAQLAGGSSTDLIGQIRKSTGLDELDIVTEQNGSVGVRVGRYIGNNLRVGVTAGSAGAKGTIDLDITKNVKARAEAGSGVGDKNGETGGKVGVYYEKEY